MLGTHQILAQMIKAEGILFMLLFMFVVIVALKLFAAVAIAAMCFLAAALFKLAKRSIAWFRRDLPCLALLALIPFAPPAQAWNALGHKVVCEIAWQQIDQPTRDNIVATLRRHPRFDEDFAKKDMPTADVDRWIFWHAGTWPDIARGIKGEERKKYNMPTWHYVNYPLFLGPERPLSVNLGTQPEQGPIEGWNVIQATRYCLNVLDSSASPEEKAIAYSWVFHLVADMHQPLHSTALFCDRFPKGDRGGNSIKTKQGRNLHALWDNLLGRSHKSSNVLRVVAELKQDRSLWAVETSGRIDDWIAESHQLARSFVYPAELEYALAQPGELQPLVLPEAYLKEAGQHARARIVAAGVRLGVVLGGEPQKQRD